MDLYEYTFLVIKPTSPISIKKDTQRTQKNQRGHNYILSFRYTHTSYSASSGKVDIYTLKELLGHSSIEITQRYAHLVRHSKGHGIVNTGKLRQKVVAGWVNHPAMVVKNFLENQFPTGFNGGYSSNSREVTVCSILWILRSMLSNLRLTRWMADSLEFV